MTFNRFGLTTLALILVTVVPWHDAAAGSPRDDAEQLIALCEQHCDRFDRYDPDIRLKKMRQARELLLVGHELDPSHPDINAMLATIDADIQDLAQAAEQAIDDAGWAGHTGSFSGPGSTADLAPSARTGSETRG